MRQTSVAAVLLAVAVVACQPAGGQPGSLATTATPTSSGAPETATPAASPSPTPTAEASSAPAPSPTPSPAGPVSPSDDAVVAAELNPPVGEPCTTPDEVVPLGGAGVDLRAVCRRVEGDWWYYRLETARVLPHAALLSGHRCYAPETPTRDNWLNTKLIFMCVPLQPGGPGPGVWQTSEGTPEASASTPGLFFLDVYREALAEPLGEECQTPGEVLSRFDAGSAELLVTCHNEVAGHSFYQLSSVPPGLGQPDGHGCTDIGNKSAYSAAEGHMQQLFCAEIEPGVGVQQRIIWSPNPAGIDGPCEPGSPDWYAEQNGLRLRISCRVLMGATTWAVVEATPISV